MTINKTNLMVDLRSLINKLKYIQLELNEYTIDNNSENIEEYTADIIDSFEYDTHELISKLKSYLFNVHADYSNYFDKED